MKINHLWRFIITCSLLFSLTALCVPAAVIDETDSAADSSSESSEDTSSEEEEDTTSAEDGPGYPDEAWWGDSAEPNLPDENAPGAETSPAIPTWNDTLSPALTEGQVQVGEIYLAESTFQKNPVKARITALIEDPALADNLFPSRSPQSIVFEAVLETGEFTGTTVSAIQSLDASTAAYSRPVSPEDSVYLSLYRDTAYAVRGVLSDYGRLPVLAIAGGLLVVLLLLCCRGRCLRTLLVLILSGGLLLFGVLPMLQAGMPALPVFCGAAALLSIGACLLLYGLKYRTLAATAVTLLCLTGTGVVAYLGHRFLGLNGIQNISFLRAYYTEGFPFSGSATLIGGVLLAAIGALITVTNATASGAEPIPGETVRGKVLFAAGCRRGAAALSPIVLTLGFFAVGITMSSVALLSAGGADMGRIFSDGFIALELVRLGLIGAVLGLSVPLTSFVCMLFLRLRMTPDGAVREIYLWERLRGREEALFGKISDKLDAAVLSAAGETEKAEEAIEESQTEIDEALEEEISEDKAALEAMEKIRAARENAQKRAEQKNHGKGRRNKKPRPPKPKPSEPNAENTEPEKTPE